MASTSSEHLTKLKGNTARYCKTCDKHIFPKSQVVAKLANLSNWEVRHWAVHINSQIHKLLLPKCCSIINIPKNPTLHIYRSYCNSFGPVADFKHDATKNVIRVAFKREINLTAFIQQDRHVINNHEVSIFWDNQNSTLSNKKIRRAIYAGMTIPKNERWMENSRRKYAKKHPFTSSKSKNFYNSQKFYTPPEICEDQVTMQKTILEKLDRSMQFHEGTNMLIQFLQREQSRCVSHQSAILSDFKSILPSNVNVMIYGSRCTNLNIHTSDYNIHIASYQKPDESVHEAIERLEKVMCESQLFSCTAIGTFRRATVLECVHVPTKGMCGVTVGGLEAVISSQLLRYYFHINKKVNALSLLLKFWYEGQNRFSMNRNEFSPYTLCLMIVFFFQQSPFKFPSVGDLQKDAAANFIDGYNYGFDEIRYNSDIFMEETVESLFLSFINFYLNFDYYHYDINVYTGRAVLKTKFLDDPLAYYTPDESLSIQDPFMHKFCLTRSNPSTVGKLQMLFNDALRYASTPSPIFDIVTKTEDYFTNSYQIYEIKPKTDFCTNTFISNWFEKVRMLIFKICVKVLKGAVTEMPTSNIPCEVLPLDGAEVLHLRVLMFSSFFGNRITFLEQLWERFKTEKTKVIDQDAEITDHAFDLAVEYFPRKKHNFEMFFTLILKKDPVQCSIIISFNFQKMICNSFYAFFKYKLPEWFAELVEDDGQLSATKEGWADSSYNDGAEDAEAVELLDGILLDENLLDELEDLDSFDIEKEKNESRAKVERRQSTDADKKRDDKSRSYSDRTQSHNNRKSKRLGKREREMVSPKEAEKRAKKSDVSRTEVKHFHESILNDVRKQLDKVEQPPTKNFTENVEIGPSCSYRQPITAQLAIPQLNSVDMELSSSYTQRITMQSTLQQWNGSMEPSCSYTQPMTIQPETQQWNNLQYVQPYQQMTDQKDPAHYSHENTSYFMQKEDRHSDSIIPNVYQRAILTPERKQAVSTKQVEAAVSTQKLFTDKKISLSDFLTISAKPEVQPINTEQLKKKIKVIARVQRVITSMSNESYLQSGFIVRPTSTKSQPPVKTNCQVSPLQRRPKVRFCFTSLPDKDLYETAVLKILKSNEIINKSIRLGARDDDKKVKTCDAQTQTMKVVEECQDCKNRNRIEYATTATQFLDADFGTSAKANKQLKSLANFTPAQLRAFQ